MKARIWLDRETGRWCYDVRGLGLRATGDRRHWELALAEAFDEMRWISSHRYTVPEDVARLSADVLAPGWV